jgi:hypothetical protein
MKTGRTNLRDLTIEYHDAAPDRDGKRRFTLRWTGYRADLRRNGQRAQCFHADVRPYLTKHPRLRTKAGRYTPSQKENA